MQYVMNKDGSFKSVSFPIPKPEIVYDDVVDRSTFSLDADRDNARKALVAGSSSIGSYDDEDNLPSDLAVKIRSGKLDKAEVAIAIKAQKVEVAKTVNEHRKEVIAKNESDLVKARQEYLDKQTGFTGQPEKD